MEKLSLLCVATLLGCAGSPDGSSEGDPSKEEQGGVVDTGDHAVGLEVIPFSPTSSAICAGTLIGQDVVLTACHCVPQSGQTAAFYTGTGSPSPDPTHLGQGMVKHDIDVEGSVCYSDCPPDQCPADKDIGLLHL